MIYSEEIVIHPERDSRSRNSLRYERAAEDESGREIKPLNATHLPDINIRPDTRLPSSPKWRLPSRLHKHSQHLRLYLQEAAGSFRTQKSRENFFEEIERCLSTLAEEDFKRVITIARTHKVYDTKSLRRLVAITLDERQRTTRQCNEMVSSHEPGELRPQAAELSASGDIDLSDYDTFLEKEENDV